MSFTNVNTSEAFQAGKFVNVSWVEYPDKPYKYYDICLYKDGDMGEVSKWIFLAKYVSSTGSALLLIPRNTTPSSNYFLISEISDENRESAILDQVGPIAILPAESMLPSSSEASSSTATSTLAVIQDTHSSITSAGTTAGIAVGSVLLVSLVIL